MDVPPFINIGGTCPPCPIGIDAPVYNVARQKSDPLRCRRLRKL